MEALYKPLWWKRFLVEAVLDDSSKRGYRVEVINIVGSEFQIVGAEQHVSGST